jgi:hypothetical protein
MKRQGSSDGGLPQRTASEDLLSVQECRSPEVATVEGTSLELLTKSLDALGVNRQLTKKFPTSPKALIGALRRVLPALRTRDIVVELPEKQETCGDNRGKRLIRIAWPQSEVPQEQQALIEDAASRIDTLRRYGS